MMVNMTLSSLALHLLEVIGIKKKSHLGLRTHIIEILDRHNWLRIQVGIEGQEVVNHRAHRTVCPSLGMPLRHESS